VDIKQMQQLMAQAQERAQEMQSRMAQVVVEASVGGGAVSAKMNGQKQLLSVTIEQTAMEGGDREMLQDLIVAAVNECGRKVDATLQSSLGSMLGGLNIPGLT